ncbi:unnamed protein product, partial [marine sediment metagenome]
MKKLITIGLALVLVLALAAPAMAQSQIEPSEVNIVLPPGSEATIEKTVTITEDITTDVWGVVTADTGLIVALNPPVEENFDAPGTVVFTETISVDPAVVVGTTLFATVTFYANSYPDITDAEIGKQTISVTNGYLDIKPGSYPNSINTKSNGVIPVALLGSANLDVTTVDVMTLRFGPNDAQPKHHLTDPDVYTEHLQDVNYDGYEDLVSHYKTKQTGIAAGQVSADLDYDSATVS